MADEFVRALDRGIAILCAFSKETPALSVADAAAVTGLTRGTARRLLLTLQEMGYVAPQEGDSRLFALTPKVLRLGYGYLASQDIVRLTQPFIQQLAAEVHEPVTMAKLDGLDYVVIARAEGDRIVTAPVSVGTRRPAHLSSLGKLLLAGLDDEDLDARLDGVELSRPTAKSIADPEALRHELAKVRQQGWAVSDEELEDGLISVGAPLLDRDGQVVAAINTVSHTGRTSLESMLADRLPMIRRTAAQINESLTYR